MIAQEKLTVVEKAIREVLPRLLENTDGCIFKNNWHGDLWEKIGLYTTYSGKEVIVLRSISDNEIFVDFDETFCVNPYEDVCYTLIGHDILLTDVLEWLGTLFNFSINHEGVIYKEFDYYFEGGLDRDYTEVVKVDFSKHRLSDQSEELWDFLYSLIENN